MSPRPPEFKPYRVAVYAVFLAFVLTFIGLIGWSVGSDIYARPAPGRLAANQSVGACVDELDALYRKLAARDALHLSPGDEKDWNTFSHEFEDRLALLQERCLRAEAADPQEAELRAAIAHSAAKLENLRQHLSRCGEEGESERKEVAQSIAHLRRTAGRK